MALLRRLAVTSPRNVRALSASPTPGKRNVDELDLTFNNPKDAFKSKKTSELVRAYFVYQICSVNWVVEHNDMVSRSITPYVTRRKQREQDNTRRLEIALKLPAALERAGNDDDE
ncbi:hypothetical protein O0L34_g15150 [Tuta absoluta]|nr:hypothetical protein O0L34_g15150 [Tuta absoluta]